MTRSVHVLALVAVVALGGVGACNDDRPTTCGAAAGASATCEAACTNLFAIDCRIGAGMEECVSSCESGGAVLDSATRDRVQACYAAATTCAEVDGCSHTCGPGGGVVPYPMPDGSVPDAGGGDAGGGGVDAGATDDAGSDDAG